MIWYLLYPFRGTTEPPILASNHPLRRAFFRYGQTVARHWLAFILLSVIIAVSLCYPVFFLYENPRTGFSKLPLHVWTSARVYDGAQSSQPDIVIRQVWVHGDHMGALKKEVLHKALQIQNILVPKENSHDDTLSEEEKWSLENGMMAKHALDLCSKHGAVHSPLIFWNCSARQLDDDTNILDTIHDQTDRRSFLNLTLRPTSVFAGKSFAEGRLQAADALVITFFQRQDAHSAAWDKSINVLAAEASDWGDSLYPSHGHVHQSRLYEFQQMPLSSQDSFFMMLSYLSMVVYVVISLGKLRAVKSWAGLLITVIIEMMLSIIASFSVCGMLKIDLARLPDTAYPFVVFVMGLENMFRLINAVLSQKPELPTAQRIGNALSEVGHLALATAAQMLFVLWLLSRLAPTIGAFCNFAAIALVFDFVFHLTFFLAVLSVDVRRMELQDSLERAIEPSPKTSRSEARRYERQYWLDALLQGRLPFSSRIAGSAISISFILGLNMHFYESSNVLSSLWYSLRSMVSVGTRHYSPQFVTPPINPARTPAAWLRIQDYRYAQEVLQYVRPNAHNIVARIYDPLVIVVGGSNRNGRPLQDQVFLQLLKSMIRKHIYPFVLALVFSVAVVTLLMQYLLWNELPEESEISINRASDIDVDTLPRTHRLDIIHLVASARGHCVSVGLDKMIAFATYDHKKHLHSVSSISATMMTPPTWPVSALCMDESGHFAAICGAEGTIMVWNLIERRVYATYQTFMDRQSPVLFTFVTVHISALSHSRFLVLCLPDGRIESFDSGSEHGDRIVGIFNERITEAFIFRHKEKTSIYALTRGGKIRSAALLSDSWVWTPFDKTNPNLGPNDAEGAIKQIFAVPELETLAIVRLRVVELVSVPTMKPIHTFAGILTSANSFSIMHSPGRICTDCQSISIHSFSMVYQEFESQDLIIRNYVSRDGSNDHICLAPTHEQQRKRRCQHLDNANDHVTVVHQPGTWHATQSLGIIGIRTKASIQNSQNQSLSTNSSFTSAYAGRPTILSTRRLNKATGHENRVSGLLQHRSRGDFSQHLGNGSLNAWEVWSLSSSGEFHAEPLHSLRENAKGSKCTASRSPSLLDGADGRRSNNDSDSAFVDSLDDLLVAAPGPIVPVGQRSVLVAFGNKVEMVTVGGKERFEMDVGAVDRVNPVQSPAARQRKKALVKRSS